MNKYIREITTRGDPIARIQLPSIVLGMLKSNAKKNKRRIQDQFIKTLAGTFKHEETFAQNSSKYLSDLKEVYKF